MFSTWQLSKITDKYNKTQGGAGVTAHDIAVIIMMILFLLILDIMLIVYAIYCLSDCAKKGKMPIWLAIVLGIMLFSPGVGSFVAIGAIIYHLTVCDKNDEQRLPAQFF